MTRKKKEVKSVKPSISFARQLAQSMIDLPNCVIDFQIMSDNSAQYVNIEKDGHELCISFDVKRLLISH